MEGFIKYYILKIIWMPLALIICMMAAAVVGFMFKEAGWDVPYRWLCLICAIAWIGDYFVNGGQP